MTEKPDEEIAARAADIVSASEPPGAEVARRRLRPRLPGLTRAVRRTAGAAGQGARYGGSWLSAQVLEMAPRIKVRNRAQLVEQFPGRDMEDIADALVDGAARATAAAGGTAGLASVLPVLPAFPAEVVAETLVVVGIEIKLVAELHEIYGVPASGGVPQRTGAYVAAWAQRRGISVIPGGVAFAAGSPLAKLLSRRLAARAGRSAFSLGPLLTGAVAGAYLNSRETRRLGQHIRRDLRRRLGA
jgi:hypothetical protein